MFKALTLMLVGAFATSYAEYRFQDNLYDLVKDKVSAVLAFFRKK